MFGGVGYYKKRGGYVANNGVNFNGVDTFLRIPSADFTISQEEPLVVSFWARFNTPPTSANRILFREHNSFNGRSEIWWFVDGNTLIFNLRNSSNTLIGTFDVPIPALFTWYHFLFVYNEVFGDGWWARNDTTQDILAGPGFAFNSTGPFLIGAIGPTGTGNKTPMDLQEFFITRETMDNDESSRRKFRTADGHPAFLGEDGSLPFGTQPLIYLKNPFDTFHNNLGTIGNFTVSGTITDSGDKPFSP
jgi:hypothetical protein